MMLTGASCGGRESRAEDERAACQARFVVEAVAGAAQPDDLGIVAGRLVAVETIIDEKVVREIIPQLKAAGAEGIIEYPLNKLIY